MSGLFDLTSFLTPVVQKLVDYIPDPVAKAKASAEATTQMLDFITNQNNAQLAVNQAEASSKSLFVAGWRPFIGWCCGAAFVWSTMGSSIANWLLLLIHPGIPPLPTIDSSYMSQVLMAMLGLGGMRTYEKVKGASAGGSVNNTDGLH